MILLFLHRFEKLPIITLIITTFEFDWVAWPYYLILVVPDPKDVSLVAHRGRLPPRRIHPVALEVGEALRVPDNDADRVST